MQSFK